MILSRAFSAVSADRRSLRRLALLPLALLLAVGAACSDDPDPPRADEVRVSPTSATLDRVGATVQLLVSATDQYGAPFEGTATWSSSASSVATVDASGVVTAVANGTAEIRATIGEASGSAQITVAQVATSVEVISGNGQTGVAGDPLANPIRARALDGGGAAVPGVTIAFAVTAGNGTLGASSVTAGTDGVASTTWTLGPVAGAANTATASLAAGGTAATFSASATPGPAAAVEVVGGANQSAAVQTALPSPIEVLVEDRLGNAAPGATVAFTVASGGGSVSPASTQTNSQGRAATNWTLGSVVGSQSLGIASGSGSAQVSATATLAPGAMVAFAGTGQSATVGTDVETAPAVRVTTTSGVPVPGITVEFEVTGGGGTVAADGGTAGASALVATDANGVAALGTWTLGTTAGAANQQVTASLTGLDDVVFTAAATAGSVASFALVSGAGQSAIIQTALDDPIVVGVADEFGNPVPGVTISFSVDGGSTAPASAATGANGRAATVWTLGSVVGTQSLTASTEGLSDVVVTAVGESIPVGGGCVPDASQPGFQIQVCYVLPVAPAIAAVFDAAAARWEQLITGDLTDIPLSFPENTCWGGVPATSGIFDDLVIFAIIEPIDGPSGILGAASPCYTRIAGDLPITGVMIFDEDDLDELLTDGELDEVIVHEMGHVLGIGSLWGEVGLLENPTGGVADPTKDTHFTGPLAIAAFDAAGGAARTVGAKVPVENTQGGTGTLDSHWRESTMATELMTGFLNSGVANPLSAITVQSLADMGYVVDPSTAEAYTVAAPDGVAPLFGRRLIELGDDVLRIPLKVVDANGRVVRMIERR